MRSLTFVFAAAVLALAASATSSLAASPAEQPSPPAAQPGATPPDSPVRNGPEMHTAPQAQTRNAPAEAQLTPPPDAEKAQRPPGFTEVLNPAFPSPQPEATPAPVVDLGRGYERADLTAYFAAGSLAKAKAEFDVGRYTRAFDLLSQEMNPPPPVRYLRAIAALRSGNARAAADGLAGLVTDYPAMRDRCLTHGGIANEELGRWDVAAQLFEQVPSTSKLYVDARFGLSRVKRHLKDLPGAIEALRPLATLPAPGWGRDVAAEALIATADLAAAAKDATGERDALLTLWSNHPLSPLANPAEKRLKGKKLPDENKVARGESLIDAHRNALGMKVIEPLLPSLKLPAPLACRAHFAYGKGLRKERSHTQAIQVLQPVVDKCKDPDLRARALYVLGSSRSIVDLAHGPATYELLARDYPAHSFADDALFYAADLYVKNGDTAHALERLEALATRYPGGDFLSEGLFKTFWIQRSLKKNDEAFKTLDTIDRQFAKADESYDLERSQYWRARMLDEAGKKTDAADRFEALAYAHPATYYGLLARGRLGDLDKARATKLTEQGLVFPRGGKGPFPLHAGTLGNDPHFLAGVELLRLGFPDGASNELLAANRAGQSEEPLRLLVTALATAGDQRGAHAIARIALRKDLSGRITEETRPIWEVAYPLAFRDLIEKHCATAKIDPDMLQALMREESALDPKALSWAGALGLTQLMPGTARAVAKANKLGNVTPEMLLEPDLNIRLGALNLGSLFKRFVGTQQYAIAGYNAGDSAVNRWLTANPTPEIDVWVEEIPIAETRGYVKRVLRSFNTYQLLYPKPVPPVSAAR